jgi:hypothetical protein
MSIILLSWLTQFRNKIIWDHEVNIVVTDQMLRISQTEGKECRYNEWIVKLFVDFKKGESIIQAEARYKILIEFHALKKHVKLKKICNERPNRFGIGM